MAGILPEKVELEVVTNLFADAERMKWTYMSQPEHTRQYRKWLQDPKIGGLLNSFMLTEEARLWIKDGPMKEFARALHGQGKYSFLIKTPAPSSASILRQALGTQWNIFAESQRIKPLRITAYDDHEEVTFAWGPVRDFKHLLWAALSAASTGDSQRWVLCLTSSFVNPTPRDVQEQNLQIGRRCGLQIIHLSLRS